MSTSTRKFEIIVYSVDDDDFSAFFEKVYKEAVGRWPKLEIEANSFIGREESDDSNVTH